MLVKIQRLRDAGVRLKAAELVEPVQCVLLVGDSPTKLHGRGTRSARALDMQTYGGAQRDVLVPLFEPRLVTVADDWFSLTGIELRATSDRIAEHVQVWKCWPV